MNEELKRIFSENLRNLLEQKDKTQADLCRHMKVSSATVSDWCNGRKMPRTDKIQSICNWLGVELSALLEDSTNESYYINPESAQIAQEIFDNPELRALFDASRNVTPDQLRTVTALLKSFKETNPDA